ncbi:hypothetical protein Bbelb_086120 [Branchiostoma belcheri]|nr:hypothetical protein Bbelb_086120 [Branchiostoma belcheri]
MYIKTNTICGQHTVTETRSSPRSDPSGMIRPLQVEWLSASEEACDLLFDDTAEPFEASALTCAERENYFHEKHDEINLEEKRRSDVSVNAFQAEARGIETSQVDQEFTTTTATKGVFLATIHDYTETTLYDEEDAFFILCDEDTEEFPSQNFEEIGRQETEYILSNHLPCGHARSNVRKSEIQETTDTEPDNCTLTTNEIPTYLSDDIEKTCPQDTWQSRELNDVTDDVTEGQTNHTTQELVQVVHEDFRVTDDTTEQSDLEILVPELENHLKETEGRVLKCQEHFEVAHEDFQETENTTEQSDLEILVPELEKHFKETEEKLLKSQEHFLDTLDGHRRDSSFLISLPSSQATDNEYDDSTLAEHSRQATDNDIFMLPYSQQNKTVTETLAGMDKIICVKGTGEGSDEVPLRSSLRCAGNPQSTPKKQVRFSEKLIIELDKFGDFHNSKVVDISEGTPIEKLSGKFDDICDKGRTFFRKTVLKKDFNDNTDEFKPPVLQRRGRKNRWRRNRTSLSASRKQLVYSAQSVGTLWL